MIKYRAAGALAAIAAVLMLAGGAVAASDRILLVTHQGVARSSIVYVPQPAKPGPRPLVIVLHGLGNTGAHFRPWSHFDRAAERAGFVVAYPDAIDRRWNYGPAVDGSEPKIGNILVDDVGFIKALIDDLVTNKIADPRRIYVAGMSRGGMLAMRLACEMSERIAGIAVIAGIMTAGQRETCRPARPVPMMMISGTADHGMPFSDKKPNDKDFLSVLTTMQFWGALHGCRERSRTPIAHRNPDDPTHVMLTVVSNCRSGASLRLYGVIGGGHRLPVLDGSDAHKGQEKLGPLNRDIESADEILAFFQRTKPTAGFSTHD
jgi:polyhydroxybutyrate depolymerase